MKKYILNKLKKHKKKKYIYNINSVNFLFHDHIF